MNPMQTCLTPTALQRLLDDEVTPSELGDVEEHLNGCERCRELLQAAGLDSLWQQIVPVLSSCSSDSPGQSAIDDAHGVDQSLEIVLKLLGPTDDPHKLGRIGVYEVVGIIGCGGMGVVFKAFEGALNRFIAIKMMLPHLAASGAARKRFIREGRAAAAVVDDHVLPIYGVSEWQGVPYLVMQYLSGMTLERRVRDRGPLELREILRIGMQTARGLKAAHAQGLVHRDVKPSNILLDGTVERAMLTDFGLARAVDDASITRTGIIAGTPQYMSPEQARGGSVDARSDLFSLGSVLYFMSTGRPPFRGDNSYAILRQITDQEPGNIQEINPDIPAWMGTLVARLMAKQPGDRPANAQAAHDLLEQCLAHLQQPEIVRLPASLEGEANRSMSKPARGARFNRFASISIICGALIVALIGAFGRLGTGPSDNTAMKPSQPNDVDVSASRTSETLPPNVGQGSERSDDDGKQLAAFVKPVANLEEEPAFQRFDSQAVCEGACLSWRDYVRWWNETMGTPLDPVKEIPRHLWANSLIRLNPKYVYAHGVNVVIVRSSDEIGEEGIYVALSIASSRGPDDEQFTRTFIASAPGGGVHTFRRKGRLERIADKKNTDATKP